MNYYRQFFLKNLKLCYTILYFIYISRFTQMKDIAWEVWMQQNIMMLHFYHFYKTIYNILYESILFIYYYNYYFVYKTNLLLNLVNFYQSTYLQNKKKY